MFPAGHGVPTSMPVEGQTKPAGHARAVVMPAKGQTEPAEQLEGTESP